MSVSDIFGNRLAKARASRGLSQADLANEFKISRLSVTNWENGHQSPSLYMAIKLAKYLGFSLDNLKDDPSPSEIKNARRTLRINKLKRELKLLEDLNKE